MAGGDLLVDRLVAGGFLRPVVLLRGLQLRRPALSCWRVSVVMGLSGLVVEPLAWLQSWLFARRLQT
ncbi:MAG: sulfotransferase, partial [Synechococcus sp. BS301-5m-G53]|nr:sulfotransferase [Synechococcus sp. BS301-5m-G53]